MNFLKLIPNNHPIALFLQPFYTRYLCDETQENDQGQDQDEARAGAEAPVQAKVKSGFRETY
jgi:hypothetical protein